MTVVELRHVKKVFADATIDVSATIDSGQQLVLLGPSGSGKSTILRMIAGLTHPDGGDIMFDGQSVAGVPPERRHAAMVFQSHALFPFRTVGENVAYGMKVRQVARRDRYTRVARALESVHLSGFADRWPSELSGGEQQRVALARAIVVKPRVLLLDEPLSSLDPVLREELQGLVRDVQRELKITSVFVTHDRAEALAVADQLAIVLDGKIAQHGNPGDVFDHPASAQVGTFLGAAIAATP